MEIMPVVFYSYIQEQKVTRFPLSCLCLAHQSAPNKCDINFPGFSYSFVSLLFMEVHRYLAAHEYCPVVLNMSVASVIPSACCSLSVWLVFWAMKFKDVSGKAAQLSPRLLSPAGPFSLICAVFMIKALICLFGKERFLIG